MKMAEGGFSALLPMLQMIFIALESTLCFEQ